jgi:tetratricopeptide (TPR) repeat protein
VLFIPLVPLQRFRIQNECGGCTKHYRSPLDAFQQQLAAAADPLREAVRRAPRDAEAQVALVRALLDFGMTAEAEQAAGEAVTQLPKDVLLNRIAGDLAAARGDFKGATPFYRRAAAAAPQDPAVRTALGANLIDCGINGEAARELEAARSLAPDDRGVLSLLARSYESLSRWAEALDLLERLRSSDPAALDEALLVRIRKCKEALRYPMSEAERKAGRRWWPWGGARSATPAGKLKVGWRPTLLLAGGVSVVVLGGTAAVAYYHQNHVPVWFDNGLGKAVSVSVDGAAFNLPPGPEKHDLAPGRHLIVVSGREGEIERYQADVPRQPLWRALTSSDFYVYNVAEAHVYHEELIGYSARENQRTYSQSFIGFERFRRFSGIDYVFAPAPETISMSSSQTVAHRKALNVPRNFDYNNLANVRYSEGKPQEAEKALRKALSFKPCHAAARKNLVTLLRIGGRAKDSVGEARQWMATCPDAGLEGHRAYQDGVLAEGGRAELVAEYAARLDRQPDDAESHYLLGRVLDDPERSLARQQEALRLDPKLVWAELALAYDLMALERYPEALAALGHVLQDPRHEPQTPYFYAVAAVAAGQVDEAGRRIVPVKADHPDYESVWNARWLLALAREQWAAADGLLRERSGETSPAAVRANWIRRVELMRARRQLVPLEAAVSAKTSPRPQAAIVRFERLIEEGRYVEAAAWFDEALAGEEECPQLYRLYAAAGLLLAGEAGTAAERLHSAMAEAADASSGDFEDEAYVAMAEALAGRGRDEDVLRAARRAHFMRLKDAYFLLGARAAARHDAARANHFFQMSVRASVDLGFPREAARRLASEPAGAVRTASATGLR